MKHVKQKIRKLNDKVEKVGERHSLVEVKQACILPFGFNCRTC